MKEQLIKACRMHAEGEMERAKTNILVYMNHSVGIGEHSDIVEAIQEECRVKNREGRTCFALNFPIPSA